MNDSHGTKERNEVNLIFKQMSGMLNAAGEKMGLLNCVSHGNRGLIAEQKIPNTHACTSTLQA